MFERPSAGDFVLGCPLCDSDDFLTIRFYSTTTDSDHKNETWVGCKRCNKWFFEAESRWAYAAWNAWASDLLQSKGIEVVHRELFILLAKEAEMEKAYRDQRDVLESLIAAYVDRQVLAHLAWKVGDRFEAKGRRSGVWSVTSIEARYTINRGLIWIMQARNVLPSGRLGDRVTEFWSGDEADLRFLPPYWAPWRWDQVHAGDECLFRGQHGRILALYSNPRGAELLVNGRSEIARHLRDIMVPVARVTANCD